MLPEEMGTVDFFSTSFVPEAGKTLILMNNRIIEKLHEDDLEEADQFFNKQHLFLMESVSERKFLYPGNNKEKVLASRISGLKDPLFILLATQIQSFSFYNEIIKIGKKNYINGNAR